MGKKQELARLLKRKQSEKYYAKKLGITIDEVRELKREIYNEKRNKNKSNKTVIGTDSGLELSIKSDVEIKTLEDLIQHGNIDTNKWKVSRWICNTWGNKQNPSYQVKAWLSPLNSEDNIDIKIKKVLEGYKSNYKPISNSNLVLNKTFSSSSCLLLSLPDAHLDKKTINSSTIEEQIQSYKKVLDNLLLRAYHSHNLEEIVFVIGNDFMHTDSFFGTTTRGTPLEVNTTWDDAYEKGFNLLVESVSKLKNFCKKLTVILTQGNHSRTKEYYLAHALEVYFKPNNDIKFIRDSRKQKVYEYGETLFCFNHGDNVNDKLPITFATTFYKEWGRCKYKEIILGDKHHNSEKLIRSQGEVAGVRMRILPCLSGTDTWHEDNLFVNAIQAGIALVYDKKMGKISEFEFRA